MKARYSAKPYKRLLYRYIDKECYIDCISSKDKTDKENEKETKQKLKTIDGIVQYKNILVDINAPTYHKKCLTYIITSNDEYKYQEYPADEERES